MSLSPYYGFPGQNHDLAPNHGFYGQNQSMFDPFSLFIWDKMHQFPRINMRPPPPMAGFTRTKIDYQETPEAHHFVALLPGVRKEEVQAYIEPGNMLHISGRRSLEKDDINDNWRRFEHSSGEFVSRFKLPPNSKPELMRTSMENGMFTVTVPKARVDAPYPNY